MLAVLDAAHMERPTILAAGDGGMVAALLAATHPDRVASLVWFQAQARSVRGPGWPYGRRHDDVEELATAAEAAWGTPAFVEQMYPYAVMDGAPGVLAMMQRHACGRRRYRVHPPPQGDVPSSSQTHPPTGRHRGSEGARGRLDHEQATATTAPFPGAICICYLARRALAPRCQPQPWRPAIDRRSGTVYRPCCSRNIGSTGGGRHGSGPPAEGSRAPAPAIVRGARPLAWTGERQAAGCATFDLTRVRWRGSCRGVRTLGIGCGRHPRRRVRAARGQVRRPDRVVSTRRGGRPLRERRIADGQGPVRAQPSCSRMRGARAAGASG